MIDLTECGNVQAALRCVHTMIGLRHNFCDESFYFAGYCLDAPSYMPAGSSTNHKITPKDRKAFGTPSTSGRE